MFNLPTTQMQLLTAISQLTQDLIRFSEYIEMVPPHSLPCGPNCRRGFCPPHCYYSGQPPLPPHEQIYHPPPYSIPPEVNPPQFGAPTYPPQYPPTHPPSYPPQYPPLNNPPYPSEPNPPYPPYPPQPNHPYGFRR
ncbi:unnamed protein product [Leptosia nina]|uniref:Uncharacterized protein n=1 Tax=Leptosia nina TaxID=320188 RepID=A0AAV1K3S9_9NEOP